jgi:hypothetical protein
VNRARCLSLIVNFVTVSFTFTLIVSQAHSQRTLDTSMQAGEFGSRDTLWEDAHGRRQGPTETVFVPMLDIYSPVRTLIYHGTDHDTERVGQILSLLPTVPSSAPSPSPDVQMSRGEILEITPELAKWKDSILSGYHFVVVSISVQSNSLTKHSPYYIQNHAVDSIPTRLGVEIDIVHINLASPRN